MFSKSPDASRELRGSNTFKHNVATPILCCGLFTTVLGVIAPPCHEHVRVWVAMSPYASVGPSLLRLPAWRGR
eukprot:7470966-Pyramimonas_sp.AAC.1